ncbi:esterase [Rhodococcus sp. WMMA185]|uniref:alpha/beta hydrolase n=1 Tax=Rhodococcus sp. WMMA185 TaxID=679318 RepID=UPI00087801CC|nr:alpha/beta hydrolase family protein [Rhodococcus sp. WMMA185]AOW93304.1 esterase [Rhodococcus sp. WMMA185]
MLPFKVLHSANLRRVLAAALLMLPAWAGLGPPSASAESITTRVDVYSPSMGRWIPNDVISPASGGPAPTFYLLSGIGGGADGISWFNNTGVREFFADKHVNVVMPIGGQYSMYTDWIADDPVLGRNKWQTYLTSELPAAIDSRFDTTGVNAIGGVSMAGSAVLDLAMQTPGFYRAVGSYSGCPITSGTLGQAMVRSMVELRGGGNAANMWGGSSDPRWVQHDPMRNAERLRGTELFISSGNGVPSEIDDHHPALALPQTIGGGVLEMVTNACAVAFQKELEAQGIPATFSFLPYGTHSWGLFETELRQSWPLISRAIGA